MTSEIVPSGEALLWPKHFIRPYNHTKGEGGNHL